MSGGIIKRIKNLFHVPGEDVTLIGFDDNAKSIRVYSVWSKQASRFTNTLEGKTIEGNVAQPYLIHEKKVVSEPSTLDGILTRIKERAPGVLDFIPAKILDEGEPQVTHTVSFDNEGNEVLTFSINRKYGHIFKTDDKPEGVAYLVDMQSGQGCQLLPKQMKIAKDPVLDFLMSANPFFFGSAIDSFIATELLRGKVEWWKTLLFGAMALTIGLLLGMGMG